MAGSAMAITLQDPDGGLRHPLSKGAFTVPADGLIIVDVPGSGGYGPPAKRNPAALADDLKNGYVSEEAARRDYGVKG
jgi:N-methylhydantoinase B